MSENALKKFALYKGSKDYTSKAGKTTKLYTFEDETGKIKDYQIETFQDAPIGTRYLMDFSFIEYRKNGVWERFLKCNSALPHPVKKETK